MAQATDEPRAQPSRAARPKSRRRRQDRADSQEQQQIDQRNQPDEVPGHQVQTVGRADGPVQDPRSHFELAGGQTAPGREHEHVERAEPVPCFGSSPRFLADGDHGNRRDEAAAAFKSQEKLRTDVEARQCDEETAAAIDASSSSGLHTAPPSPTHPASASWLADGETLAVTDPPRPCSLPHCG